MPDVFQYFDFREYLRDYYREKKAASKAFSYLNFARKAKISSSGFLLHVIKGERNLTRAVMLNVAQAMGLDKPQAEYFGILVAFGQAKSQADKALQYEKLMGLRQTAQVKRLDDHQYAFYSDWYHSVIRELVPLLPPEATPAQIGRMMIPVLAAAETAGSLKLQEELGILRKRAGGAYVQSEPFIGGSGAPSRKLAITRFQQAMLEIAGKAWDNFAENEISMHTATLTFSEGAAKAAKAELKECTGRLLALAQGDTQPAAKVYHVNLNLFPVTRNLKGSRA
jgi:uncharacterized protein (TIGR02147 family)